MSYGIKLHVWGDYACFTRPEMKAERVSYDVMTPSAARGVLEAIYWKPQIRWVVDKIQLLKPIKFTSVRRNEVGTKFSTPSSKVMEGQAQAHIGMFIEDERQQRASLILRDVAYVIEAHIELLQSDDKIGKHLDIFNRRARAGQFFQHPYLGTREFPASFALVEPGGAQPLSQLGDADLNRDFGFILHDIEFDQDKATKAVRNTNPRFFRAVMKDGVIDVPPFSQAIG